MCGFLRYHLSGSIASISSAQVSPSEECRKLLMIRGPELRVETTDNFSVSVGDEEADVSLMDCKTGVGVLVPSGDMEWHGGGNFSVRTNFTQESHQRLQKSARTNFTQESHQRLQKFVNRARSVSATNHYMGYISLRGLGLPEGEFILSSSWAFVVLPRQLLSMVSEDRISDFILLEKGIYLHCPESSKFPYPSFISLGGLALGCMGASDSETKRIFRLYNIFMFLCLLNPNWGKKTENPPRKFQRQERKNDPTEKAELHAFAP